MPIYEYRCETCDEISTFFVQSVNTPVDAICEKCKGTHMRRLISRVAFKVSSDQPTNEDYYKDPSNIGKRVEQNLDRFGVDMPDPIRKTIDEARQGKMPEGLNL